MGKRDIRCPCCNPNGRGKTWEELRSEYEASIGQLSHAYHLCMVAAYCAWAALNCETCGGLGYGCADCLDARKKIKEFCAPGAL